MCEDRGCFYDYSKYIKLIVQVNYHRVGVDYNDFIKKVNLGERGVGAKLGLRGNRMMGMESSQGQCSSSMRRCCMVQRERQLIGYREIRALRTRVEAADDAKTFSFIC